MAIKMALRFNFVALHPDKEVLFTTQVSLKFQYETIIQQAFPRGA
jgi:hypothetical protein